MSESNNEQFSTNKRCWARLTNMPRYLRNCVCLNCVVEAKSDQSRDPANPQIELEFSVLVLVEGGKPEDPGENPRSKGEIRANRDAVFI